MAQQFLYAPEAARGKDGGLGGVVHGVVFPSMLTLLRIDRSRRYVRAMPSSIRSAEGAITKVPRRSGRRIGIVKIHSAWSVTRLRRSRALSWPAWRTFRGGSPSRSPSAGSGGG